MVPAAAQTFLAAEQAFYIDAQVQANNQLVVNFKIAKGYYMYQERFEFSVQSPSVAADQKPSVAINDVKFPPAKTKYDPTFEKDMGVYDKDISLILTLSDWPTDSLSKLPSTFVVNVVSQGCADQGICYPPVTSALLLEANLGQPQSTQPFYRVISITANVDDEEPARAPGQVQTILSDTYSSTPSQSTQSLLSSADDSRFAQALSAGSFWSNVGLFFLLGVLLSLTPCVLPMIPILSVLIVGQGQVVTRMKGLGLAASYVAGMSIIYTALGVLAGLSGVGLAAWLQTPWVLGLFATLMTLMGLAMFDVVRIEMPQGIQAKLSNRAAQMKGGKSLIAFLMGAVSALIVGPCVAAPLAGALIYISQTQDVWLGAGALFAMAWGMGLPLLVVGASAGSLIPKAGPWMEGVKAFFGVLLLGTAWWMLSPVLSSSVQLFGWAVLAIFTGMLLGTFDPRDPSQSWLLQTLKKTIGLTLMILALLWMVGAFTGARSILNPLVTLTATRASATTGNASNALAAVTKPSFKRVATVQELDALLAQSNQPVMLDFYADWCVSCKEMEAFTFSDPQVINRMQKMLLLKADVTRNTPDDRALLKKFNLFGPPGIIFFNPGGTEIKEVRVVGFQKADQFAQNLDRVLNR